MAKVALLISLLIGWNCAVAALGIQTVQTTTPGANVCAPVPATPAGQYYVRALAIDDSVNHSALSNEVLKTLPDDVCWVNPTQNVDNSALIDLAAIEVVWSTDPIIAPDNEATCAPAVQGLVVLAQEETVYTVIKQIDRFVLLPIGVAPAGTTCDPDNSTNGHGAVPRTEVIYTSPTGPRPIVVVAQCNG